MIKHAEFQNRGGAIRKVIKAMMTSDKTVSAEKQWIADAKAIKDLNDILNTIPIIEIGGATVSATAVNTLKSVSVTYTKTFPVIPRVFIAYENTTGSWIDTDFHIYGQSKTGFSVEFANVHYNFDKIYFNWVAIGSRQ